MQFVPEKIHKVLVQDERTLVKNVKWSILNLKKNSLFWRILSLHSDF
jgi:hypothetical protein